MKRARVNDRVFATYWMETPYSIEQAADVVGGEQSSGTFIQVPGETADLRERFRARTEEIRPIGEVEVPSLPGAAPSLTGRYQQAEVTLSFSIENMGTNLPTLIATVAGNLFELRDVSGLKLLDITLPDAFREAYPGPQFGIQGTRELVGVYDRPIIGTIVKPSVGLSPEATAELVRDMAGGDIDFVKDDELMANPPHSPIQDRVSRVMAVINDVAERKGKKVMFAFNITDELDAMLRHYDTVKEAGGTCVMVSLNSVGPVALAHLRKHCELPIHGHRNGWGMLTRSPVLGVGFRAYQKIWRLAGADHLHVNGLQNKFWEPDDSVVASIQAMHAPFLGGYRAMPVISSGQTGLQAPETYTRIQSLDVMYLAGGGIMAHPGGPPAGNIALRQCWEAAVKGIELEEYAKDHTELAQSIEKFGANKR